MFKLILKDSEGGEANFPLAKSAVIGREKKCEIVINDKKVSRQHTRLTVSQNEAFVEDLGSRNGTFVNGEKISKKIKLSAGDLITIGTSKLRIIEANPLMDYSAPTIVGQMQGGPPPDATSPRNKMDVVTNDEATEDMGPSVGPKKKFPLWVIPVIVGVAAIVAVLILVLK